MNYKDLENISYLSQQILTEAASEEHDVMNRWPYSSPYLQEERAPGVKPYKPSATQAEVRADAKKAREKHVKGAEGKSGYGPEEKFTNWKDKATPSSTLKKKKEGGGTEPESVSQRMDREHPYKTRMTGPLARAQGSRIASAVTRTTEGPGEPQAVTMPRKGRGEKAKPSREIIRRTKQNEEFKYWVNSLLDEGYDLSDYTWDEMAEMYIMEEMLDESAAGDVAARAGTLARQRRGQTPERKEMYKDLDTKASMRARHGSGSPRTSRFERSQQDGPVITPASSQRASTEVTLGGGTYERGSKRLPKSKEKYRRQVATGVRAASSQEKQRLGMRESYDLYDLVLSHLIDEGYAETQEAANAIMANMSEGWVDAIVDSYIQE